MISFDIIICINWLEGYCLDNLYVEFCCLCYRGVNKSVSKRFCSYHQPKSYLYNRDRSRLKKLVDAKFAGLSSHLEKIQLLSTALDEQTISPEIIHHRLQKKTHGRLTFECIFETIRENYPYSATLLEEKHFHRKYSHRWLIGWLHRLDMNGGDDLSKLNSVGNDEPFEAILYLAARYQSYMVLAAKYEDKRLKSYISNQKGNNDEIIKAIRRSPRKPNGKVDRSKLAVQCGVSRHKMGRVMKKLKSNGDIAGDL